MTNERNVSIMITTKNRSDKLRQCLDSIKNLSYLNYEVVVVDGSTSHVHKRNNQKLVKNIKGKYVFEKKKGAAAGHNTGIKNCNGRYVAVTDDDCIVSKNWLDFLLSNFTRKSVAIVTGRTIPSGSDEVSRLFEKLVSFDRGPAKRKLGESSVSMKSLMKGFWKFAFSKRFYELTPAPWGVGYGNNIAYRKDIFEKIGFWDETLGRGTKATGGDDTDLIYRVLRAGFEAVYEPRALVYHDHRPTYRELLWDVSLSNGRANFHFLRKHLKNDPYALMCYIGGISHLLLVIMKSFFTERRIIFFSTIELLGWLNLLKS